MTLSGLRADPSDIRPYFRVFGRVSSFSVFNFAPGTLLLAVELGLELYIAAVEVETEVRGVSGRDGV